jgi:hypothetical protein
LSDEQKQHEFLAKKSITKLDHPPYSPDLAPCDFWLFPELKTALKGCRFDDISDIQHHVVKEPFQVISCRNILSNGSIL